MSIATEITRLQNAKASIKTSIESKGGTVASNLKLDGYASCIDNIPTSGSTPTGTKQISITENGTITENVIAYASAEITVNVPSSGSVDFGGIFSGTYPSGNIIIDTATTLHDYSIYKNTATTSIFSSSITSLTSYAIQSNSALQTFVGTALGRGIGNYGLSKCANLEAVDIAGKNTNSMTKFAANAFNGNTKMSVLILRGNYVPTIVISAFAGTPFASGRTGGTLYVPSSMISEYEADSEWATILGYETNSIQAIEGSIYETQYADGTAIE